MADADAEAAFINSMQALNNIEGGYEAAGASSEQQTDSSSDEYDPAQAVQAVQSPVSNHVSSHDASKHDPLPSTSALPVTSEPTRALQFFHDTTTSKAHSQSRSMSRASSSSMDDRVKSDVPQPVNNPSLGNLEEGDIVARSTIEAGQEINKDVKDPVPRSSLNTSINRLSSEDVLISNNVQDQNPSSSVEIGAPLSIPVSAVSHHIGHSSHSESTADQKLPTLHVKEPVSFANENTITPSIATPRVRLPHDRIGILEDRIKEDPRGDLDAWLNLIGEHRKRGKFEDARNVYERFLGVFPSAAEQWVAYAQMENEAQDRNALENIFARTLLTIPNVQLWSMYLDHVRRHNNTTTDVSGAARQTIHQAYELALQNVGLDKDSGKLWQDYVQFIKSGPGIIGGSNWQDQQKMDLLRKTYQRAICLPNQSTNLLWKEYDGFEMGLNKITGRKFLQDQSPSYMSARSSHIELQNITRKLRRTTLAVLPPASGFDGDVEYTEQLEIWKRWVQWEKDDPLVLKQEDIGAYRDRIVFVYKQALMSLRFWPELWCDAADFSFSENLDAEGTDFLTDGMIANPESCLLAFKRADRLELTTVNEEGDEGAKRRGDLVREPYDKVLDALYDLASKAKARENQELARVEAQFTIDDIEHRNGYKGDDSEDYLNDEDTESREKRKTAQLESVKDANSAQVRLLTRTISFIWIALMRAMRRIQGKGIQGKREEGKAKTMEQIGGSRQIFADARKRGRVTSDVYVASALIEFHCYEVDTSKKIFERGLKLFPEDEVFALEYVRYLINTHDYTNARAVFETVVSRLGAKPETLPRAKPLYALIHDFESRYGELAQITKLEKRMCDLFPEDPLLIIFSRRFANQDFDPTTIRPIVSPATQSRPKTILHVQTPPEINPIPSLLRSANSPKRPLLPDDSDTDGGRPRKFVRGESPLKGAAGRRLDQQKRNQQNQEIFSHPTPQAPPPPALPRDVLFLLSIIPKAETYHATKFKAEEMVRLIRETNIPGSAAQLRPPPTPVGLQQMPGMSQIPPAHHIHQPQQRPPIPQVSSMPHMQQIQQQLAHAQQMQSLSQAQQPMSIHQYPPGPPGQYNGGYSIISPSAGFSAFSPAPPILRYTSHEYNGSHTGPFTPHNVEQHPYSMKP